MKTPKTIWIVWSKKSLRHLKASWGATREIFCSRQAAQIVAEDFRSAGFEVQVTKYERGK